MSENSKCIYGIDLGGTTAKMGLFDSEGNVLEKWEVPTRKEEEGRHIIPDLAASVLDKNREKSIDTAGVLGIGLGVPGPVNSEGVVLKCANLGWDIVSVADEMKELTGIDRVMVGNDANVAALGEQWKGGGRGCESICMVTLGTGIGGGLVFDGAIVTGKNGAAGEIGHMVVNPAEERACGCGKHGCMEQYASATAIMRDAAEKMKDDTDKSSLLWTYDKVSGWEIFDAYKKGDDIAKQVVGTFAKYLGLGLSHVAQTVDPEAFVIGGGVSKNGPVVIDVIREEYEKNVMYALKGKEFKLAELGNDAGMYGAVKMVL